jgi:enamine deaminase RidA (YjgF/YER057c/UK114 family)
MRALTIEEWAELKREVVRRAQVERTREMEELIHLFRSWWKARKQQHNSDPQIPGSSPNAKERPEMQITHHNPRAVHRPSGDYSMGLELSAYRRLLFVSGQVPERADGSLPEGFEAQCEQAWANILEVLKSADLDVGHLVKINTFLTDRNQLAANRAIRRRMLQGHEPASTVVVVDTVESQWLLEIEAIAAE